MASSARRWWVRIVLGVGLGLAVLYVAYGLLLWSLQERMIYPAPGGIERDALEQAATEVGAESLRLTAADGTALYGWYRAAEGKRALLYFHGNGESVADSMALMRAVNRQGWDFGIVAYRGYPGSEGTSSRSGIRQDARALWDHTVDARGIPASQVVVLGRSLGGAVALELMQEVTPAALVLESTFARMEDMARRSAPLYPVNLLLRHNYDSLAIAPTLTVPVLHAHSHDDQVIPFDQGRQLSRALPDAEFVEVRGLQHQHLLVLQDPAFNAAWKALLKRLSAGH